MRRAGLLLLLLLLLVLLGAALAATTSGCLSRELGGAYDHEPEEMIEGLSPGARVLVADAYADLGDARPVDHHVHVLGTGSGGTGCFVNPAMLSWTHPVRRFRFLVYASAAGVDEKGDVDARYVERLLEQIRHQRRPGVHHLLAFDKAHDRDGREDLEHTEFHVPNDHVLALAKAHPDVFRPTVSIHPYRGDAIAELERCHAAGARHVKWLPSAMRIDPADTLCAPFYERMRELGMVLLTHVGEEKAVEADEAQAYGNPLLLRPALDAGVTVIAAHCASLGDDDDLDHADRPRVASFDLFLRLLDEPRYDGLLYGDISALTQANRLPVPLRTLLERPDLHDRLVNGSDYPLPAVNVVIRTRSLVSEGFITADERKLLNEIYDYNPLLFDYVVKRTVRHPETGARFPARMFTAHPDLP